jgi:uncharacterized caspase-like protein
MRRSAWLALQIICRLLVTEAGYQHADKLANPVTDARRLREALAKLGFDVVHREILGKQTLERTVGR